MTDPAERRSFLVGMLGGVTLGGGTGFFSGREAGLPPLLKPGESWFRFPNDMALAQPTFAQQGEDVVVAEILLKEISNLHPTYVDIGAHDPIRGSNTYLFYRQGFRGVLVEPNPTYAAKLREARPGDVVVEAGIGDSEQDTLADYYVIEGDGQLNTFVKEHAEDLGKLLGRSAIKRVMKIPMIHVNKLLAKQFPNGGPDFLSVDTEGYDYAILKALDFERFRPQVICAEANSLESDLGDPAGQNPAEGSIIDLLKGKDYEVRGGSFLNTVFLDRRVLERALRERRAKEGDGG